MRGKWLAIALMGGVMVWVFAWQLPVSADSFVSTPVEVLPGAVMV